MFLPHVCDDDSRMQLRLSQLVPGKPAPSARAFRTRLAPELAVSADKLACASVVSLCTCVVDAANEVCVQWAYRLVSTRWSWLQFVATMEATAGEATTQRVYA
jgi:hypothetical protein